jgi:nucleotide-binding universal stress UspA family protein
MYKAILIATDGSNPSIMAVRHGVGLAKSMGAAVVIITVTELWSGLDIARAVESGVQSPIEQYEALAAKTAQATLDAAEAIAKDAGIACETMHVRDHAPAEGVVATAKEKGCDLIVVGTHGHRGLNRYILGSQAAKVLSLSEIPVLVVR